MLAPLRAGRRPGGGPAGERSATTGRPPLGPRGDRPSDGLARPESSREDAGRIDAGRKDAGRTDRGRTSDASRNSDGNRYDGGRGTGPRGPAGPWRDTPGGSGSGRFTAFAEPEGDDRDRFADGDGFANDGRDRSSTDGRDRLAASGRDRSPAGGRARLDLTADDELDDERPAGTAPGLGLFLRRLLIVMVWVAFAVGLGVGVGLIYQQVRSTGSAPSATAGQSTPSVAAPSAAATSTPTAASTPTVPSDWVAVTITSSQAASTFSHPSGWTEHVDGTTVMYLDPNSAEMVGVARRTGVDGAGAISKVEALEFNGLAGFAVTGSGQVKDPVTGATVYEVTGTYTRQGQQVAFMMHSVDAGGGVAYVLIVRAPVASSSELDTMMTSLRASFHPSS